MGATVDKWLSRAYGLAVVGLMTWGLAWMLPGPAVHADGLVPGNGFPPSGFSYTPVAPVAANVNLAAAATTTLLATQTETGMLLGLAGTGPAAGAAGNTTLELQVNVDGTGFVDIMNQNLGAVSGVFLVSPFLTAGQQNCNWSFETNLNHTLFQCPLNITYKTSIAVQAVTSTAGASMPAFRISVLRAVRS